MNLEMNYEETENTQENTSQMNVEFESMKETTEYSSDGSPVLVRLTPEQQQWFKDFSERMGKKVDELNEFIQEQREYHAVHASPVYDGLGPTEEMYRYDADKEFEKNGNTARYRELLELAEDAKLRRELGHW